MRFVSIIFLMIFALPSFASVCYKPASFYGCTNASGTNCTKTAVTVLVPDLVTAVSSCNYLVLDSSEQLQLNSALPISTYNAQISAVGTRLGNVESRVSNVESRISGFEDRSGALEVAYNAMVVTVNGLSSGSGGVSVPADSTFDLQVALSATAFFFATVLFFYGISKGAGAVLTMIRSPMSRRY